MKNFNKEQKDELRRQYELLTKKSLREREYDSSDYSERDDFHRDYTRILYSSSFRRLQGKMQILGIEGTAFFRNRLTHSLEVAQIAHSIATNIGKLFENDDLKIYQNDLYVIDAAALAHDIGHPAFGHKGERVLDTLAKEIGKRFEGNAQNYRVLRSLEKKEPKIRGLNLTNRTLMAINKYLIKEDPNVEKFMYSPDYDYLTDVRSRVHLERTRTLDAQIIEVADDIAYSVHDLEDALALRYFSIDELLYIIKYKDTNSYEKLNVFVNVAREYAFKTVSLITIQDYSQVFRKSLISNLTHQFINDVTMAHVKDKVADEHGTDYAQMELQLDEYKNLCKLLSKTIYECVMRDPIISLYEKKGEIVLKGLYNIYSNEKINEDGKLLPPDYRPREEEKYTLEMGTIDYLAGMMDTFAISKYKELCGTSFDEISLL